MTGNISASSPIQPEEIWAINNFIFNRSVVFAVGGCRGDWLKQVVNNKDIKEIHAFEALATTYYQACAELWYLFPGGKLRLNNIALSDNEKPAGVEKTEEAHCRNRNSGEFSVYATTLDKYCSSRRIRHINFLKISAAGEEFNILRGAETMLSKGAIDFIQFEHGNTYADSGAKPEQAGEFLKKHQYQIFRLGSQDLEPADFRSETESSHYLVIHNRLIQYIFEQEKKLINLEALPAEYGILPRGVVHVGAHEGQKLRTYQGMGIYHTLMIEANPAVYDKLAAACNSLAGVVTKCCAVSDVDATVPLYCAAADQSSSLLPLKHYKEINSDIQELATLATMEVVAKKLDTLLAEANLQPQNYNILNIDSQGSGLKALRGAPELLKHIEAIKIRVYYDELYAGCGIIYDVDDFLAAYGFIRVDVSTPYHPLWGEALYLKKPGISMTTLGSQGRFGNQIFQYAFLKIYAQKHGLQAEVPQWIGSTIFDLKDARISRRYPQVRDNYKDRPSVPKENFAFETNNPLKNKDVCGYFQYHTKYYRPYQNYFRSLFKFTPEFKNVFSQALREVYQQGNTLVAIHLRRGKDIRTADPRWAYYAPTAWYLDWLQSFWHTLDKPVLYVASDDLQSVSQDFSGFNPLCVKQFQTEPAESEFLVDFYILMHADILAIANSTFGFAAAMLNQQGKIFFRSEQRKKMLIPFDPWNSEPLLWD
ncbi:MAG TPA: FkbM family methyltransferase [Methylomusa anaerophila]|uniref:Glycosyl transferase family 11 n=1 Tax=Methylomusa anaerophila TaxID=1930071 RepID=A0A348AG87_9FIRM|nr:FkbM family methyltransferase [Methylomusa anaerophila]BBB90085.1 glycosyl transferase family 11 [Methylomusa anaerophila]HML88190.1 FkbM family methyltransferase [Methylomusa anaerophila]